MRKLDICKMNAGYHTRSSGRYIPTNGETSSKTTYCPMKGPSTKIIHRMMKAIPTQIIHSNPMSIITHHQAHAIRI